MSKAPGPLEGQVTGQRRAGWAQSFEHTFEHTVGGLGLGGGSVHLPG